MMSPPLCWSGEPVLSQLVGFGGNFLKFKSGSQTVKWRKKGVGCLCCLPSTGSGGNSCDRRSHLAVEGV